MFKTATAPSESKRLSRRLRRGQAMVEYSVITHVILLGGIVAGASPVVPVGGTFVSIVGLLFSALTGYYESVYSVLAASTL